MAETSDPKVPGGRIEYNETDIPSFLHHVVSFDKDGELGWKVTATAAGGALRSTRLSQDRRTRYEAIVHRARDMQAIIIGVIEQLGYRDELQPGSDFLKKAKALRGYGKARRNFPDFLEQARQTVEEAKVPASPLSRQLAEFQEWYQLLLSIGTAEEADRIVDRYAEIERDVWLALYRGPIADGRMTLRDL